MMVDILLAVTIADTDGSFAILAVPPGVAAAIYYFTYRYYRNQDKRYNYEHETETEMFNPQRFDSKVDHRKGLKKKRIAGHNSENHIARVRRLPVAPPQP